MHRNMKYISKRRIKYAAKGRCKQCGSYKIEGFKYCKLCRIKSRQRCKKYSLKLKLEVMAKYGGAHCACCKESELTFLTIDHINRNGNTHRKEIGFNIYGWLKKNNYPYGYRILCMNCNWGLRFRSECPHKEAQCRLAR